MNKKQGWKVIVPIFLASVLAGCVTGERMSGPSAEEAMEAPAEQTPKPGAVEQGQKELMQGAEAAAAQPVPPEDPCLATVAELVARARTTMKTVRGNCQEKGIEVNPMWSVHYDGTVRIRIFDAAGVLQSNELSKP